MSSVAFSPDGKTLATGSHDKTVIVWNIDMAAENLNKRICEIVNRNFSKDEWREYAAGRAYRKACTKLPGPDDPDWPFASAAWKVVMGQLSHPDQKSRPNFIKPAGSGLRDSCGGLAFFSGQSY